MFLSLLEKVLNPPKSSSSSSTDFYGASSTKSESRPHTGER